MKWIYILISFVIAALLIAAAFFYQYIGHSNYKIMLFLALVVDFIAIIFIYFKVRKQKQQV